MYFKEIEQFIEDGRYEVNVPVDTLEEKVAKWENEPFYNLRVNPDFQRGHVWTEEQQTKFIEFFLRGGKTGLVIYFNKPDWHTELEPGQTYNDFVLVDGLQRLTALRRFLAGHIKAFGLYCHEFKDNITKARCKDNIKFNINTLKTKADVLKWYLEMNTGGVVHTPEEIEKVRLLLKNELQSL